MAAVLTYSASFSDMPRSAAEMAAHLAQWNTEAGCDTAYQRRTQDTAKSVAYSTSLATLKAT